MSNHISISYPLIQHGAHSFVIFSKGILGSSVATQDYATSDNGFHSFWQWFFKNYAYELSSTLIQSVLEQYYPYYHDKQYLPREWCPSCSYCSSRGTSLECETENMRQGHFQGYYFLSLSQSKFHLTNYQDHTFKDWKSSLWSPFPNQTYPYCLLI